MVGCNDSENDIHGPQRASEGVEFGLKECLVKRFDVVNRPRKQDGCCDKGSTTIGQPSAELSNHGYIAVSGERSKELNITKLDGKWFSPSQRREL
jgi:hypothetical protein